MFRHGPLRKATNPHPSVRRSSIVDPAVSSNQPDPVTADQERPQPWFKMAFAGHFWVGQSRWVPEQMGATYRIVALRPLEH